MDTFRSQNNLEDCLKVEKGSFQVLGFFLTQDSKVSEANDHGKQMQSKVHTPVSLNGIVNSGFIF